MGHGRHIDRHDDRQGMHHPIGPEIAHQGARKIGRVAAEVHDRAADHRRLQPFHELTEFRQRTIFALREPVQGSAPLAPGLQQPEHEQAEHEREPAARRDLLQVARHEHHLQQHDHAEDGDHPAPAGPTGRRQQGDHEHRVDQHGDGHANAIGTRQSVRTAETDGQRDGQHTQRPVHERYIDLSGHFRRRLHDAHPRQQVDL